MFSHYSVSITPSCSHFLESICKRSLCGSHGTLRSLMCQGTTRSHRWLCVAATYSSWKSHLPAWDSCLVAAAYPCRGDNAVPKSLIGNEEPSSQQLVISMPGFLFHCRINPKLVRFYIYKYLILYV